MEIPPHLQQRTKDLLQELGSELGKDVANQFISACSAVYYGDNGLPVIDPRVIMDPGSPGGDDSWKHTFTQDSDYSPGNVSLSSNHDLDEILEPSLHSTGSVSYDSSPPLDDQSSHSEADPDLPMCKRCDCEQCKKRAKRKRGKTASIETVASLFHRPDLINILDKYWEVLQVHGLFADQSREPFQWSNAINRPVHVQRREYHLILRKLEKDDDLQQWRRFVAEYRTLEGYNEFHREATKQRINGTQARGSGENDNNKAHKEYVKHMFPDGDPETLLAAPAALKKDLQLARRWAIWVEGYETKDGLVPGLGVGVGLLVGLEIKKRIYSIPDYDHAYLKLLLKHIHETHPNIVSICRILEPVATSLVRNHQLSSHDDWDTISKELREHL
ncbi:hypothetical protein BKA64DRAFT_242991 [Cadophora sp. MPI-SDFR-AT-0126]|nr:hypothetical protein BKA64DRAFT_242991 [Leotiomycetes sp. MPI-SDFR-AT-0126]